MGVFKFPLARLIACFIPGILTGYYLRPGTTFVLATTFFLTGVICLIWMMRRRTPNYILGLCLSAAFFFTGIATISSHDYRNQANHYLKFTTADKTHSISASIKEKIRSTAKYDRYIAYVRAVDSKRASGMMLLNIKRSKPFPIGTKISLAGKVIRHRKPMNPGQFDYGQYLDDKSIATQMYPAADLITVMGREQNIRAFADDVRTTILTNLAEAGFNPEELHVTSALLLGQQQEIDPEIIRHYQYAGAVHILSVSGLHVGFILLIVQFLLKRLPKNTAGSIARISITIVSLWAFSLIAGFSPSVIRSATMFSFVAVGMFLKRDANVFHTLWVSMFMILVFEPFFLFDVGFQLSYCALFFILWLQPILSDFWQPSNRILKYFWDIITVSFAAQIGTLPLTLYYFHQFPGLFFITNLVVIPFLSVIMIIGVIVMILALCNVVPIFLTNFLEWSVKILNLIIAKVASYEQFVFTDIPFSFLMMLAAFSLTICVIMWLDTPSAAKMQMILISVILFQTAMVTEIYKSRITHHLIVFNKSRKTLLAEKRGRNLIVYGTDEKTIIPYKTSEFTKSVRPEKLPNVMFFKGKKIAIIDSSGILPTSLKPEVMLLCGSPKINLARVLENNRPKTVVADGSNYKRYVEKWEAACHKAKIPFHYTMKRGSYKLE